MDDTWAYDQPPLLWITEETLERMETTRRERLFFSYYRQNQNQTCGTFAIVATGFHASRRLLLLLLLP